MFHLLAFIIFITSAIAEPLKPTTEAFWKATNELTDISGHWINNYKIRTLEPTDPLYKELEKPETIQKLKVAIKEKWAKAVESQLTEKEIVYLTQLYSHPLLAKMNNIDTNFWSPKLNSVFTEVLKTTPSAKPVAAPAAPATRPATAAPAPTAPAVAPAPVAAPAPAPVAVPPAAPKK